MSLMAALAAASVPAAAAVAPADYRKTSAWLCLPGRADACSSNPGTIMLLPSGYGKRNDAPPAAAPGVDCFIVYPTASLDQGLNADMTPGPEEAAIAQAQFARFASVCRPFAPVYRQMTVASIAAHAAGADITPNAVLAYRDVAAAWADYWKHRNQGRPVVLLGHSQGSLMLIQLIANVIEKDPAMLERVQLAIVPGYNLYVPQGKTVGGDLKTMPLCSAPGQRHCALAWTSFRTRNAPPVGAMFGYSDKPGMTVGCVNPVRWGSRTWESSDSVWYARSRLPVPGGPIQWSSTGQPSVPYVHAPGLTSVRCVNQGARGYLEVRVNDDPADARTDRVGGEVGAMGMFFPGWGMHMADIYAVQGNLVSAVGTIGASAANERAK